jgi:hypothetical protein
MGFTSTPHSTGTALQLELALEDLEEQEAGSRPMTPHQRRRLWSMPMC